MDHAGKGTARVLKGFREFILRGNVIDLAVAVVIGAAFTAVVNSIVENVFNPLIGALFNASSLKNAIDIPIGDATIKLGAVLGAIITFLIVAAVVYFVFVMPMNLLKERTEARRQAGEAKPEDPETELTVLAEIRDLLAAGRGAGTGSNRADER
jgi:large conductance mechanosensitive channel